MQANVCIERGDIPGAWSRLERAHVLSQSRVVLHLRAHWAMLRLAWQTGAHTELRGQLFRLLVAGPGSALGRAPLGNTGRASVSAFAEMRIADEMRQKLVDAGVKLPT